MFWSEAELQLLRHTSVWDKSMGLWQVPGFYVELPTQVSLSTGLALCCIAVHHEDRHACLLTATGLFFLFNKTSYDSNMIWKNGVHIWLQIQQGNTTIHHGD